MNLQQLGAHEKWGSDEYMLSRKPTLITHHYCLGRHCGIDNGAAPAGYQWVRATTTAPDGTSSFYSFLKRRDRAFGPFPATSASTP